MRRYPTTPLVPSLPLALLGCLLLALPALLVGSPGRPAEANTSQEFKDHGFKWDLPEDWKFGTPSPDLVRAGFVAKAECSNASLEVWIYTAPTDGLDVDERIDDVKSNGAEGMGVMSQAKVVESTLSGIPGKAVAMQITSDGSEGYFRTYVISKGGNFYQMIMRCWHGAQFDELESLNAVRKGFRLLKGAGSEDKSEAFDEFGGPGAKNGAAGEGGKKGGGGSDDGWPAEGAKKEGNKVILPTHNVEWTLPEGPLRWNDAPTPEKAEEGRFVVASGKIAREATQEFEKDLPASTLMLDLIIQKIPPRLKVDTWVKGGDATDNVEKWKMFDTIDAGKTRTWDDKDIGNIKGAILKLEGKKDGQATILFIFTAVLRSEWYVIRAYGHGASDVYKHVQKEVGDAIKGINFLDTRQLVRGPLLGAIPDFAWHRGEDADKEKVYKGPGFTFKKPEGMAYVKVVDSMNRDIRFTGEMRNEEGDAFLYFEVRSISLKMRPGEPMPKDEDFVNKRAEAWSAGAGEGASVGRTTGDLGKNANFNGAKGLTYEFTGDLDGVPYVEEGFVVKHKQNMYIIKFQYGGEDAEKKLKKQTKLVTKGMKFSR